MATNTRDTTRKADGVADYGPEEGMVQMQIRIPPPLKRALEEEAERLTERFGVPVSTSGVLRKLLMEGLQRARGAK